MDFEQTIELERPVGEVFAFLDDLANTPRWNRHCVRLEQVSPGERAAGTKLRYVYGEGEHHGEMEGTVREREPERRLSLTFTDAAVEVDIAFTFRAAGPRTHLVQKVHVKPRSLLFKLVSPLAGGLMGRRLAAESVRLKTAIEEGPG